MGLQFGSEKWLFFLKCNNFEGRNKRGIGFFFSIQTTFCVSEQGQINLSSVVHLSITHNCIEREKHFEYLKNMYILSAVSGINPLDMFLPPKHVLLLYKYSYHTQINTQHAIFPCASLNLLHNQKSLGLYDACWVHAFSLSRALVHSCYILVCEGKEKQQYRPISLINRLDAVCWALFVKLKWKNCVLHCMRTNYFRKQMTALKWNLFNCFISHRLCRWRRTLFFYITHKKKKMTIFDCHIHCYMISLKPM